MTYPVGAIIPFGAAAAPSGWLLCDGTSYSKTTYAGLWAVIGYTYGGSGDDFNVPDLRQRFVRGKDGGSSLGDTGGTIDHVHTGPSHSHSTSGPNAHSDHTPTQPGDHTGLSHSSLAISTTHGTLSHSGATLSDHTVTQSTTSHGTHTSGGAHQHDTHTTTSVQTGTPRTNRFSIATLHSSDGGHTHDAHTAHANFALTSNVHSISSQGNDHGTRTHTVSAQFTAHGTAGTLTHSSFGVDSHSAHSWSTSTTGTPSPTSDTGWNNPPFLSLTYIILYQAAAETERAATVDAEAAFEVGYQIVPGYNRTATLDADAALEVEGEVVPVYERVVTVEAIADIISGGAWHSKYQVRNLVATAVSTTQINLSWDDVAALSGEAFDIERNGSVVEEDYTGTHTVGSPYVDDGLEPAQEYTYRVRAVGGAVV